MAGKVKFNLKALKELVSSHGSCVYCKEACTKTLALFPMHLKDLKRSVKDLLASEVTTYDAELDGIILAHKFVKIVDTVPLNDDGILHVNYTADVYYFKPDIGNLLNGTVYKKSKEFVGVLVHSIFNVAVPKPRFDDDESSWPGYHVSIGSKVVCRVGYLNFTGRLPYIRATLESTEEFEQPKKKKKDKRIDAPAENALGFKKILIQAPQVSQEATSQPQTDANYGVVVGSSPKKKKKTKNREVSPSSVAGSSNSPRNGTLDPFLIKSPTAPSRSSFSFSVPEASTPKSRLSLKTKRERSPRASSSDESLGSSKKKKIKLERPPDVDDLKVSLVQEALLSLKNEESSGESSSTHSGSKRKKSAVGSSPSQLKPSAVSAKSNAAGNVQALLNRAMEGIGVKSSEDERSVEGEHKKKKKKKKSKELLE